MLKSGLHVCINQPQIPQFLIEGAHIEYLKIIDAKRQHRSVMHAVEQHAAGMMTGRAGCCKDMRERGRTGWL